MQKILEILKGKKSYLAMIGLGILGILWSEGVVNDETAKALGVVLGTMAGIALRAGEDNAAEKANAPLLAEIDRLKNLVEK